MSTAFARRTALVPIPGSSGVSVSIAGTEQATTVLRTDGNYGVRRTRNYKDEDAISDLAIARAIADYRGFWEAASRLPKNWEMPSAVGRPLANPDWVMLFVLCLTPTLGSQRAAVTFLRDPVTWRILRKELDRRRPKETLRAPHTPPNLNALRHFGRRTRNGDIAKAIKSVSDAVRASAVHDARTLGLLDPAKPLRYGHVDASQWLAYDGSVFLAPSKHSPNGRHQRRVDCASGYHWKNGDTRVWGSKWVFGSIRTTDYSSRIIIDFEHVTGPTKTGVGDEARAITDSLLRVKNELPGMRGAVVDSIMAGTHIKELASNGLHVISYPRAKANPNRGKGGRHAEGRIEKSEKVAVITHRTKSGGTCTHSVFSNGGNYVEPVLNSEGTETFVPVHVGGYKTRRNADSTFRFYHELVIDCRHGKVTHDLPMFHDARDGQQFNRGELIRFYQPNSAEFRFLYGRRNDTESLHNQVKVRMRRMAAYGANMQTMVVIGMVLANNAVSSAFERRRSGLPNPIDGLDT